MVMNQQMIQGIAWHLSEVNADGRTECPNQETLEADDLPDSSGHNLPDPGSHSGLIGRCQTARL